MLTTANLLILDEPTNHLDIPAREALEQALVEYAGTLLVVSHDRYFLNRLISRLLYLRQGTCDAYPGNYADYQAHLAAQASAQQPTPSAKKTPQAPPRQRPRQPRRRTPGVIEQEVSHLEAELAALQAALETHSGEEWQRLRDLSTQQGTLAARLEELIEEWEESMAGDSE